MTARTRGPLLAAALALAAPALAEDPPPAAPPPPTAPPPAAAGPAPRQGDGGVDLRARVRSIPGGLSLEVGGAVVEVRLSEGPPPQAGAAPPGAHELRATVSVDGQERGLVVRVVPPPRGAPPPATP